MESKLQCFLSLNGEISQINSDCFIFKLALTEQDFPNLQELYDTDCIEQIKINKNKIVSFDTLTNYLNKEIHLEFITSEIEKIGFYLTIDSFIINNRFEIPPCFYIAEISYSNTSQTSNEKIDKYKSITSLIERLTSNAKFISDEHVKILFLVQDNSFIESPIEMIVYEDNIEFKSIDLIKQYLEDIDSYKEKRTIFLKELIDFLSNKTKDTRLRELILHFSRLYSEVCP